VAVPITLACHMNNNWLALWEPVLQLAPPPPPPPPNDAVQQNAAGNANEFDVNDSDVDDEIVEDEVSSFVV